MKKQDGYKILSLLLVFALMIGVVNTGRIPAYAAEEAEAGVNGEIIAFEELAPEIAVQNVPLGTGKSGLVLPDTLTAAVKPGAEEISVTGSVYGSDGTGEGITEIPVKVTWTSEPEYDGNIAGVYTFTAEIPGFVLSAAPPAIMVTVYENEPKGIITSFEELEEDIRWQNTREPILPEKVKGTAEGRTTDIPVTWEADHDYDPDSPEPGLYVFTAKAGGDYTLADGVEAPRITVYIPKVKKSCCLWQAPPPTMILLTLPQQPSWQRLPTWSTEAGWKALYSTTAVLQFI